MTVLSLTGGLALDLGTANTLIYRRGEGLVLNEPSLAAVETETRRVLAVGLEAKACLGRTPQGLEVVRPLKGGSGRDLALTQALIKRFLARAGVSRRLFRPQIVAGVPQGATELEKLAIIEAAEEAGAREVRLVDEGLAAAIGLGLNLDEPAARLILDVGGETAAGVIVRLGAATFSARRAGGDEATLAIAQRLRRRFNLAVGDPTAEQVKTTLGSTRPRSEEKTFPCRGREITTGLPKEVTLTREDLGEVLEDAARDLIDLVKLLLSQAPPEDLADLGREGLHLTGGGSLLAGLPQDLARATGLAVQVPDDPLLSVALGLGEILENRPRRQSVFAN